MSTRTLTTVGGSTSSTSCGEGVAIETSDSRGTGRSDADFTRGAALAR
jgi:hypothetical protein